MLLVASVAYVPRCDILLLFLMLFVFFFQAEDGIRDLVRSRGLGDVYKRQVRALRGGCGLLAGLDGFRDHDAQEFAHVPDGT